MALPKQKFREIVFQLLYSHDFAQSEEGDMLPFFMHHHEVSKKWVAEAAIRQREIVTHLDEIDKMIAKVSVAYDFERISRVELNLLRLGVFELFFDEEIPPKVAISEGMRLCRKFSTPEGATYINAILDHFYKALVQEKPDDALVPISTK
jgi:N utilization substance protein B